MNRIAVHPARPQQLSTAADLAGHALTRLALARWLVPDPAAQATIMRDVARTTLIHAYIHGTVHVSADLSAVAAWFDRTTPQPPKNYEQQLSAVTGTYTERFLVLDEIVTARRRVEPHHELVLLAVREDRLRQGLGRALLDHHRTHLDHRRLAAHAYASDPPARDLLAGSGFTVTGTGPIRLPDLTPIWPMRRAPGELVTTGRPAARAAGAYLDSAATGARLPS